MALRNPWHRSKDRPNREHATSVLEALAEGQAHLAASGLTQSHDRNQRFVRGPAHTEVLEQLVCHRELHPMPRKPVHYGHRIRNYRDVISPAFQEPSETAAR